MVEKDAHWVIRRPGGLERRGGLRPARMELVSMAWFHNYLPAAVSIVFGLAKGAVVRHVWPRP
jgi:hypothetical protein